MNKNTRKRLTFWGLGCLIFLLTFAVTACEKENNGPAAKEVDETIIMFFPYTENLSSAIQHNIEDFQKAIEDRGGLKNKRLVYIKCTQMTASIYEVIYSDGECKAKQVTETLDIEFNSGGQRTAANNIEKLLNIIKSKAPARSYSMIIGCHGSAWLPAGIPLSTCQYRYYAPRKAFGTAMSDGQIDNVTLATGIQKADMHMKFILFDTCYMGNIESVYDLHNVCDYYISSPNEILSRGIPYDIVGDAILNNNYRGILDGIYNFYSSYVDPVTGPSPYSSMSIIDCKNIDALAAVVKEINLAMDNKKCDLAAVQPMDGLMPTVFFDLKDYMDHYCTDASLLSRFNSALAQAVFYERHTSMVFSDFSQSKILSLKAFCGISTSQPTTNGKAAPLLPNTGWWVITH